MTNFKTDDKVTVKDDDQKIECKILWSDQDNDKFGLVYENPKGILVYAGEFRAEEIRSTTGVVKTIVRYCKIDQEYRVLLFVDGENQKNATYYTDDKEDAEGTAKLMVRDYKGA